jgi:hypothetical protein
MRIILALFYWIEDTFFLEAVSRCYIIIWEHAFFLLQKRLSPFTIFLVSYYTKNYMKERESK